MRQHANDQRPDLTRLRPMRKEPRIRATGITQPDPAGSETEWRVSLHLLEKVMEKLKEVLKIEFVWAAS